MKNKDRNPIFYKTAEEMDKQVSVLLEELRSELTHIRGKIHDIQYSYGWKEHLDHLPGGLTCVISAMYNTISTIRESEEREGRRP